MIKLQQYHIFKLSTAFLKRKNYNIKLSIAEARKSGQIVSIGDSQMLRSLRKLKGIDFQQQLLIDLNNQKRYLKKNKTDENFSKLVEIEKQIDDILFVPEIVSVLVDDISHYKKIGVDGFYVNGIKFKRLLCGSGQARRNNSVWIAEEYENPLKEILNNGRKDIEITPAKFSAYFALSSSASLEVSEPYFCVVPDYEIVREERVDYVEEVEGADDKVYERNMNITFNIWDGQGIISPRKAKEWAEELELDYVPSAFIIRSNFIKGMLAVIDFHEFANEIGEKYITDVWGNKVNIRDMDVILTQSQFKLWNAYESISDYIDKFRKNKLSWSITRVSPKEEKRHCSLNYQFIQALNLNENQMKELCAPTINFFSNVTKNDVAYSLLYLMGKGTDSYDDKVFDKIQDNVTKALILNNSLINDPFVQNHIIRSLNKKIKESYIGNLIVDGFYTMMVADPYAFLEYIFGKPIVGLLKREEHHNKTWFDRNGTHITALRAPLTWRSEVVKFNNTRSDEIDKWYKHLGGCAIYNIHGIDTMLHGGADFDGDIVCLINNKSVFEGAMGGLPIHYESKKAPKSKINENVLWESDIKGFNNRVGFVTNCATSSFALLPLFEEGSPEYIRIIERLKCFRKEQGSTIDATKGLIIKPFPIHWTKWKRIDEKTPSEDIDRIEFENRIVINKRPLFMRYVYSNYNRRYLDFNERYNKDTMIRFNKKFLSLLAENQNGAELNNEEKKLIEEYYRYVPFIQTNCLMNRICWYMEQQVKTLKEKLSSNTTQETIQLLKDETIEIEKDKFKELYNLYKKYKSEKKSFLLVKDNLEGKRKTIDQYNKYIRQEAYRISSDGRLLANMAVDICYSLHPNDNKSFVWNIFGNEIIENIRRHKQEIITIPFLDEEGDLEYLGGRYSMRSIDIGEFEDYYEYL